MRWLRLGGRPEVGTRSLLWLYRWRAFWLEQSYSLLRSTGPGNQAFPYHDGQGLIFILGFWRSGTTLVHEILAEAPRCGVPRTWQCMNPSAMLIRRKKVSSASIRRPMDQVIVTDDSPQEDEFALMAMGVPSVYRGFLDPRRLSELGSLLDQAYWSAECEHWVETLEAFLSWCWEPVLDHLVLKSPNHLFRYRSLAARYPRARFLWVLRSPEELWRSNLSLWRAMIERYGLWKANGLEREQFLHAALATYGDLLEELQAEGVLRNQSVISYEALVADPAAILPPLVDRLGVDPWNTWDQAIQARVLAKPKRQKTGGQAKASGSPEALLARLESLHQAVLHG